MTKLPIVRDHMDTVVPTLTPDTGMTAAVDFLLDKHVTGAPVVNAEGALVGIITEKDCLRLVATGDAGALPPRGTVRDFMTTDVTQVAPDMNIYFVAGLFLKAHYRRLPVVEKGKLVGAITRFDILRVIHSTLKNAK